MTAIKNGTFLTGVVLDCDIKTKEVLSLFGEFLGIYWDKRVWVVELKENCKRDYRTLFPFSPWHNSEEESLINKKVIPEKWLKENLVICGAIRLIDYSLKSLPFIPQTFPQVSSQFLNELKSSRLHVHYNNLYDYYKFADIE